MNETIHTILANALSQLNTTIEWRQEEATRLEVSLINSKRILVELIRERDAIQQFVAQGDE